MVSLWRQSPDRAELTWGFGLSFALHSLVAGLVLFLPSLWGSKVIQVPVAYEVRLVGSLPGSPQKSNAPSGTVSIPQEMLYLPQAPSVRSGPGGAVAGRPSGGEELTLPRRIGVGVLEALRLPGRAGVAPSSPSPEPKAIGGRPTAETPEVARPGVEPLLPGEVGKGSPGGSRQVAKVVPAPASPVTPQVFGTPPLSGRERGPKEVGVSSGGGGSPSTARPPMAPLDGTELLTSRSSRRDVLKDLPGTPVAPQKVPGGASEPLAKGGPKAVGSSVSPGRPSSAAPSLEPLLKGAGEKARMARGRPSEEVLMPASPTHPALLPSGSTAEGDPKALAGRPHAQSSASARPEVDPLLAGEEEGSRGTKRRATQGLEAPELPQKVASPSSQALEGGPKAIGGTPEEAHGVTRSRVDPLLGGERGGPRTARRTEEMPVVPAAPQQVALPQGPAFPEGLERGGDGGSGVTVESSNSRLANYFVLLQFKISNNWAPPRIGQGRVEKVVVSFRILGSGQIEDLVLDAPSGNKLLDDSTIRAIRNALPLPPLPIWFRDDSLAVQLRFTYIGQRG